MGYQGAERPSTALLPDIDGRAAVARRFKDITSASSPTRAAPTGAQKAGCRWCAASLLPPSWPSKWNPGLANGEEIDIGEHALLCSSLVRLSSRIGIERRARDITPDLQQYLDAQVAAQASSDDTDEASS
jgi:hypothetical protein